MTDYSRKRKKCETSNYNTVSHLTWKDQPTTTEETQGGQAPVDPVKETGAETVAERLDEAEDADIQDDGSDSLNSDSSKEDLEERGESRPIKKLKTKHHWLMASIVVKSSQRSKKQSLHPRTDCSG